MSSNPYQSNQFFEQCAYDEIPFGEAPIIAAWYLKTPDNAGHLLRLAANVGCRKVLFVKDKEEITFKVSKMKYVAGQAMELVEWQFCEPEKLVQMVPDDYTFVALETVPGSSNIQDVSLPLKMALMVGSEKSGIPADVNIPGQKNVHIPMPGPVKSMNVSHATGVCLFEWLRQWMAK